MVEFNGDKVIERLVVAGQVGWVDHIKTNLRRVELVVVQKAVDLYQTVAVGPTGCEYTKDNRQNEKQSFHFTIKNPLGYIS